MVNGRRKRLQVKRMKKQDRSWIEGEHDLAEEATQFYHHQFTQEDISSDFSLLQHVPNMVTQEKNQILTSMPTLEDVKNAVFDLSGDSSGRPDGMIGAFYQSGFVKGRCIIENILLTQEVVSDIRLRGKPAIVVLKLDMAKAYDRASGFFHSTKGVKQGDPLSTALFILSAEVLSRVLNFLFEDNRFRSYGMPKWSANLNHLAYADDTSLQLIMGILQEYEQMSGQLINKGKISFHMHSKVANVIVQQGEAITGFTRGSFPFTYLGCPITHARKRKTDYSDLIRKVKDKLAAWKGRLLSFGGNVVLCFTEYANSPTLSYQTCKRCYI
ncbi:uncharacterized protein LOC132612915 [Lycium barbarum]|uniref:uncharacterized protein LOC132612915 n=1 Tax=Lycium barbarum TaxID=112863 RepID=UPI00293E9920|nr:uncharacterized protein LOC132612915 [Lycium barbarum]